MISNISIEDCNEPDISAVQKLCDELYSEDPNISDLRVDIKLARKEFGEHADKGRLLAIKDRDDVIGYCIIIFFWSNEYSGDLIEIDEISISKSHQGQGVGTILFTWLKAQYPHCKGFTLQVANKNERAKEWYHRLGFVVPRNQHLIWVLND